MTFDEWWARQVFKDDYKEFARRVWIAAREAKTERNQCDGCQRGLPLVNGLHYPTGVGSYPGEVMGCTAGRYQSQPQRDESGS